jgi:hypothetical protein
MGIPVLSAEAGRFLNKQKINTEDFNGSSLTQFQFRDTERREKRTKKFHSLKRKYIFFRFLYIFLLKFSNIAGK